MNHVFLYITNLVMIPDVSLNVDVEGNSEYAYSGNYFTSTTVIIPWGTLKSMEDTYQYIIDQVVSAWPVSAPPRDNIMYCIVGLPMIYVNNTLTVKE